MFKLSNVVSGNPTTMLGKSHAFPALPMIAYLHFPIRVICTLIYPPDLLPPSCSTYNSLLTVNRQTLQYLGQNFLESASNLFMLCAVRKQLRPLGSAALPGDPQRRGSHGRYQGIYTDVLSLGVTLNHP